MMGGGYSVFMGVVQAEPYFGRNRGEIVFTRPLVSLGEGNGVDCRGIQPACGSGGLFSVLPAYEISETLRSECALATAASNRAATEPGLSELKPVPIAGNKEERLKSPTI